MRTSETIAPKIIELLSKVTGKNLDARDVTPPVLFLAALITVLLGVMFADQKVTEEEKQRWLKTLNRFIPEEGNARQLAMLLSKGIREQKIYINSYETLTLLMAFSESERLLLIGFGYEMSAADGSIDESEKQYLRQVAILAELKPSYLDVFEAGFTQQSVSDLAVLEEVRSLLDPARFHELDTLFVKAASDLLSILPAAPVATKQESSGSQVASYDNLKKFQASRKQLDSLCYKLYEIVQSCSERDFLPNNFVEDVGKISRKIQSQRFRVAVVGEFSQGKSTLLNALLGEELQPVRAIPCSGTITTLRYGKRKQVICRYKDGRQEEISIDEYKTKASIPKAAAVNNCGDELASSEIEELIFEHPDLELCKSGVEIIDSPGLNEHPDRTAITERLLKDTDAALFLTNASRLLPEKEKELIQDVRNQLTNSTDKLRAENLFILVNFMDLLDNDEDRQDVTQRLEEFVTREKLIVPNKNRVHYISAKAALKKQDEYLQSFRAFTQALEQFLTVERGSLEVNQIVNQLTNLTQIVLIELSQIENDIDLSETAQKQILEQIGEASGRDVRIIDLAGQLMDEVIEQAIESIEKWDEGLKGRIVVKSLCWHSEYSHIWDQKRLVADYTNQFVASIKEEVDQWSNDELKTKMLSPALKILEEFIQEELTALQSSSSNLPKEINTRFSNQLKLIINGINDGISGTGGFFGGGAAGVALAAGLYVFTFVAIVPIIIAAVAAAIFSSFGLGLLDVDGIHNKIKAEVITKGFEKFDESTEIIIERISEVIASAFDSRLEAADEAIKQIIACYENALEMNEKNSRISLDQAKADKLWITQKRVELEGLRDSVEAMVKI